MPPPLRAPQSPAPFIVPFVVFLSFLILPDWFKVDNPELPWWKRAPELWIYPLQTLAALSALVHYRQSYTFRPFRGFLLACCLGLAGIGFWITPSLLARPLGITDSGILSWLGFTERTEGFVPSAATSDAGFFFTVAFRFVRMVICVPLVEEIFWRGYLMRAVARPHRPFHEVSFGTHSWPAFVVTTVAFVAIHHHHDFLGAALYGSLAYFVAVRTKSLTACVFMHAVANLALGVYVMTTRQWGFW